jgi:hypothetical protein
MYVTYAFLMMIIVLKPCYEVMNHYVLSHHLPFHHALCTFLHILISLSLSWSNDARYFWQMVRMRTGNFTQHVLEPSNAHTGAAMNELRNATHGTTLPPPPPPSPVSLEQLLATQNELMRVLTENLM